MFRNDVRISLPDEEYIELLGITVSVFASNNGFIIENILHTDDTESWYELIDMMSGNISKKAYEIIKDEEICDLFAEIKDMRNRIIHGFRITNEQNEQSIATKEKSGKQYEISKDYLKDFVYKNEKLSSLLYDYRDRIRGKKDA